MWKFRWGLDENANSFFISIDGEKREDNCGKMQYRIVVFPKNGEKFSDEELVNLMPELMEGDIDIRYN